MSNNPNTIMGYDAFFEGIERGTDRITSSIYQVAQLIRTTADHHGTSPEALLSLLEERVVYALDTARRFHTNPPLEGEDELIAEGIIPPSLSSGQQG